MAEAFLKQLGGEAFKVDSAGLEATKLNPLAIEVMREVGIDISGNKSKTASELFTKGNIYDYIITVCDEGAENCPVYPGPTRRLHWPFADPSQFQGTREEKLEQAREVRDEIKNKVIQWQGELRHDE